MAGLLDGVKGEPAGRGHRTIVERVPSHVG